MNAGYRQVFTDNRIDWNGSMIMSDAKVQERIRRPDFGHLEIVVSVDDPKAYSSSTKSVSRTRSRYKG